VNQKEKDILKANPVLEESDFAKKLKEWAKKEEEKNQCTKSKTTEKKN
tara:strand:- start:515 stop:658 length:144 start_codon:yes stop_codon:yes gene_type:complete